ncbi:MAG: protein of unknown function DUF3419 [Edafosvirus sp.]|uniref:DUF3419 family protein n=1 Tax=Edafosvirus sp. TaxID=2487765 RepID=A0A3G4ZW33_9VIRU|nr:MAG: protein of unknown function DUF3419 [Edafosvirus sp.]
MNILFSQVREDPQIELHAIKELNTSDKLKILMITSGGCTVMSLLSQNIEQIDAIDMNQQQNYLCALKITALMLIESNDLLLKFFEGKLCYKFYDDFLINAKNYLSLECYQFWLCNTNFIYNGINQSGKFELLFKELVDSNFNYEKCFNREYLKTIFGNDAVVNSMNKEFSDHFKNIIMMYKNLYNTNDNYFYHQIIYNKYNKETNLPPYFHINKNIIKNNYQKINYICTPFDKYIDNCKYNEYHMIHTSNITDWLNKDQIDVLLLNIHKCLKIDGILIMRRLNGDYDLKNHVKKYFEIINNGVIDKSHFYSQVVVAKKTNKLS